MLFRSEAQEIVQQAIGGETVTNTIEGRERYPVSVRYQPDFRQDAGALGRLLVSDASGTLQVPLAELASIRLSTGPAMVRNEDGMLTGYVYIDLDGIDPTSFIEANGRVVREKAPLPPGYAVTWSGQYEAISRVQERLRLILPLTLAIVFLLIYCNTMSVPKTMIVLQIGRAHV